jgi:hypothetical protein
MTRNFDTGGSLSLFAMLSVSTWASSNYDDFILGYIEMSLAQKSRITAEMYDQVIKAMIVPMEP